MCFYIFFFVYDEMKTRIAVDDLESKVNFLDRSANRKKTYIRGSFVC